MTQKKNKINSETPQQNRAHAISNKMCVHVPIVPKNFTIEKVHQYISRHSKLLDEINYIYIIDKDEKLFGVLSVRNLFEYPHHTPIEKICLRKDIITVKSHDHQEKVAYLAIQHDLKEIPVVDENNRLLGAVTYTTILNILHKELREDILRMGGVHKNHSAYDNVFETPLIQSVYHRVPWLIMGILGGILTAKIISQFDATLERNIILATFIPLLVSMSDAVATQLEAFSIRDFALFRKINFFSYFAKQFSIVFTMSIILGICSFLVGVFFYGQFRVAIVLASAVSGATISALISGLCIPFFFRKIGSDPANASGPLGTIIQDVITILIYFSIATLIL